jgi:penicillin-binding protein 1A
MSSHQPPFFSDRATQDDGASATDAPLRAMRDRPAAAGKPSPSAHTPVAPRIEEPRAEQATPANDGAAPPPSPPTQKPRARRFGWLTTACAVGMNMAIGGMLAGVGIVGYFTGDLPSYGWLATYEPAIVTRVHAADGRLMGEFATERRVFVPIDAMPPHLLQAFLSAEDKNFYEHPGIDIRGIARAMVTNVSNVMRDRRMIGASTITQQVARNLLLTLDRRLDRKIREALLSLRIEQMLTKDRILELYLNEIFLGQRAYGVAAAALQYFDKPLDQITVAEAAYLAALPKGPNNYNPTRHREAAIGRRNWVIGQMEENGYLTPQQAAAAVAEPFDPQGRDTSETIVADYFAEQVRRELLDRFGEKGLYENGYSVRTTLDPELQALARQALRDGLVAYDRRHGYRGPVAHLESTAGWQAALTAIHAPAGADEWPLAVVTQTAAREVTLGLADGSEGRIPLEWLTWARRVRDDDRLGPTIGKASDALAVGDVVLVAPITELDGKKQPAGSYALRQVPAAQGALVAMDPHTGRVQAMVGGFSYDISEYNRATQAMRQTGSSFKPFVYLAGLEAGFTPATLIQDGPVEFEQGPGLPTWKPKNYSGDFGGPTTLRAGIEKSRNLMTVRLAYATGMDRVSDVARRFGIYDAMPPLLSYSLGAGETTVLRLTTAYAELVNGGKALAPTFIDRIQDRYGRTVYRHDKRACEGCTDVTFSPELRVPRPPETRAQIVDPRIAYQMVSILEGVVQRGTARSVASIGKPLGGKTGTSNDSKDTWFMGFSPDLVVGVFVGFDNPRELGSHETGSSVSAPIFKQFMGAALKDKPAVPFRVPPGVRMVRVNAATGRLPSAGDPGTVIWEAFLPGTEPRPGDSITILDVAAPQGSTTQAPVLAGLPDDVVMGASDGDEMPPNDGSVMQVGLPQSLQRPQSAQPSTPRTAGQTEQALTTGTGGLY